MKRRIITLVALTLMFTCAQAQFGNFVKKKSKVAKEKAISELKEKASERNTSGQTVTNAFKTNKSQQGSQINYNPSEIKGQVLYVSRNKGHNKNEGSKDAPFKNLQKALDKADDGATILVAEGNYFGTLNKGNIVLTKPVTIIGGYNTEFTVHDPLKYLTLIQPTPSSNGSAQGGGTIQLKSIVAPNAHVVIDGFIIDRGNSISYNARGEGQPKGVESPMMNPIGTKGKGGESLNEEVFTQATAAIYFEGHQGVINSTNVVVRNCAFINAPNYAILGMLKAGSLTVENNIFVNVRMATMDVRGADVKTITPIVFKNNTVMFVWSRLKDLGDMGYGFRMIPGTSCSIENNIFGCAVFSALDRTHTDSNKSREAMREDVINNNVFFLNRKTDLTLPGGGMFLRVKADDFCDLEVINANDNRSLEDPSIFKGKIDEAYLEGFLNVSYKETTSHDPNSPANTFRQAMGMNQVGTMESSATMYANRYPWKKALLLFGVMNDCGAQMPK